VGALIALYERAVGFMDSLVNINAYNQPGVKQVKGSCRCFGVAEADFRGTSARRLPYSDC